MIGTLEQYISSSVFEYLLSPKVRSLCGSFRKLVVEIFRMTALAIEDGIRLSRCALNAWSCNLCCLASFSSYFFIMASKAFCRRSFPSLLPCRTKGSCGFVALICSIKTLCSRWTSLINFSFRPPIISWNLFIIAAKVECFCSSEMLSSSRSAEEGDQYQNVRLQYLHVQNGCLEYLLHRLSRPRFVH